jgi:hypothetical protein
MKRTAMQHTKLKRLMRALNCPQYVAVGILESLWHLTARETPIGNIGKLSNEDISLQIDWREDPDALVQGLLASGWLDIDEEHRLLVHDWMEHCDDATKKQLERSGFVGGKSGPWIYFIRGTVNGLIKVGFTEGSVDSRLKALQTGCPERLEIIGSVRGTRNLEIDLHKRFAAYRQTGEWFSPSDELLRHISDACGVACLPLSDNGVLPKPKPKPKPLPKPEPKPEKKQEPLASTADAVPAAASPGVFDLPLPGTQGEWPVPEALYREMVTLHPAVNVMDQFAKMRTWLITNSTHRKTPKGMPRFIGNWLAKAQDGAVSAPGGSNGTYKSKTESSMDAAREAIRIIGERAADCDGADEAGYTPPGSSGYGGLPRLGSGSGLF